ncbi:iron-sulfur cluster assembly scaffold protein [Halodurantibacterium flavum]|uniref:Iron-sulfur cluster assembly scaffold protein n=1 Tax=Halodurantibacterium flavum TaxID=1382802 RepID=A0ABW4SA88_9RHOB
MSTDSDLIKLYSGRILALAADIPLARRLDAPMATVRRRAPICGSTITVDVVMKDGRVAEFGQDVKACALGQAAASVVGGAILGRTRAEVEEARDQLEAMLRSGGPAPTAPFDGLEVLMPARDYRNRHDSIMLALQATADAMTEAEAAACA